MKSLLVALGALLAQLAAVRAIPAAHTEHDDHANDQKLHARALLGSSFGLPFNQTFDYLVVGGGTAGLTIATRLAEQTGDLVGVIEAGGFYEITNSNITQIPANDGYYVGKDLDDWHPGIDWGFELVPQAVSRRAYTSTKMPVLMFKKRVFTTKRLIMREARRSEEARLVTTWSTREVRKTRTVCGPMQLVTRPTNGTTYCPSLRRAYISRHPTISSASRTHPPTGTRPSWAIVQGRFRSHS